MMNIKLGKKLLLDRRVPIHSKVIACLIGLTLFGIIFVLELPVEGVMATLLPFAGIVGDVAIDGVELVAMPLIIAALALPFIAPSSIVNLIDREIAPQN